MIQYIKGNGGKILERDMEFLYGKMEQDTKEAGIMIYSTDKELFILMKVIYIKDNFKMGKQMGMV